MSPTVRFYADDRLDKREGTHFQSPTWTFFTDVIFEVNLLPNIQCLKVKGVMNYA